MNQKTEQLDKIKTATGFIAALDQSGGSTPKALSLYGVDQSAYSGDEEMYSKVHEMRSRIMTNENFTGDKILAAILFENTMLGEVQGKPTCRYLWEEKNIIPILKIDLGMAAEEEGVQLMKPISDLDSRLERATANGIFGTKMRSLIKFANTEGIKKVVAQQFEIGKQIIAKQLVPIIEPEVDINAPDKAQAEAILKEQLLTHLDRLSKNEHVIFKLTLPESANLYQSCIEHPNVLRVVALSGGYSREFANQQLSKNNGMIASFSRALTEGLGVQQSDADFSAMLGASIDEIVAASMT